MKQKELDQLTPEELGKLFPIILSEPNEKWSIIYKNEKHVIEKIIGINNIVRIEHIGSTAIPNLISKPTIDILVEVPEKTNSQQLIDKLTNNNYYYIPKPENPPPHMMFVKGYTKSGFKGQAYHIHVRYPGDWDELYFRDYLSDNPDVALEYANLKQELAMKYRHDREGYTNTKAKFVERVVEIARKK